MTRFKIKAAKSKIGFTSKAPAKERKFAQRGADARMPLLNDCYEDGLAALCLAKIRTERGLLQRFRDIERKP